MITLLNAGWGLSEILWTALFGFVSVVVLLFMLVGVMRLFGKVFSVSVKATPSKNSTAPQPMISEEEVAAISTALRLYTGELRSTSRNVLTIMNIKRVYSPWNSKIHGLTQLPDRNK